MGWNAVRYRPKIIWFASTSRLPSLPLYVYKLLGIPLANDVVQAAQGGGDAGLYLHCVFGGDNEYTKAAFHDTDYAFNNVA